MKPVRRSEFSRPEFCALGEIRERTKFMAHNFGLSLGGTRRCSSFVSGMNGASLPSEVLFSHACRFQALGGLEQRNGFWASVEEGEFA